MVQQVHTLFETIDVHVCNDVADTSIAHSRPWVACSPELAFTLHRPSVSISSVSDLWTQKRKPWRKRCENELLFRFRFSGFGLREFSLTNLLIARRWAQKNSRKVKPNCSFRRIVSFAYPFLPQVCVFWACLRSIIWNEVFEMLYSMIRCDVFAEKRVMELSWSL